jgi:hypothetical protein
VRRLLAGGVPGLGVVVEGFLKSNKPSKLPKIHKKGEKNSGFGTFWLINRRKCRFLLKSTEQDILTKCFLRKHQF